MRSGEEVRCWRWRGCGEVQFGNFGVFLSEKDGDENG